MKAAIRALSALAQETRLAVFRLLVQAGFGGLPVNTTQDVIQQRFYAQVIRGE